MKNKLVPIIGVVAVLAVIVLLWTLFGPIIKLIGAICVVGLVLGFVYKTEQGHKLLAPIIEPTLSRLIAKFKK